MGDEIVQLDNIVEQLEGSIVWLNHHAK
jgi:hypothetical protein